MATFTATLPFTSGAPGGDVRSGASAPRRLVLTHLFTDIVDSTGLVERIGDEAWDALLSRHNAIVRGQVGRFGGREVDNPGDGFFVVFASPFDAIACAVAIRGALQGLRLAIRCGLHRGECLVAGRCVRGLAVHVAARIAAAAKPGEILASRAVRDAAGERFRFGAGTACTLRGVSAEHELFALHGVWQGWPWPTHETEEDTMTHTALPGGLPAHALRLPAWAGRA